MARKVGGGGRLRVALVLLGFVVIASGVILRRTYGISGAKEIQTLEARRSGLIAERLRLEGEIRAAGSRARLQPIAEQRLQMHLPTEAQVVYLTRGAAGSREHP
ncbi:MAG: cell division protein FtsL family protein [Gemmatimonadetes bacterium]|nr:cell division protein FtsL family protein [Gemmatimonadota bacterium]